MATSENLIPIPGRLHSVASDGVTTGADEIFDDTLNKDQATINQEVNEAIGTGGSVDSRISAAINALDASVSKSAGADGLALSVTEENGKVTAINGSIAANTYDAYGAASAAQSAAISAAATDATTKVNAAKSEIKGTATSACDTLGEAETKINANATAISSLSSGKADKATTLAGYGITDAYTKSETYTKTEVNGLVDTPHQEYVTVDAYASLPATGSKDTIYRVSNYNGSTSQVDASVYSEYAWNGSQYVFLCVKSQIGEVFDISVYNNNAKYADLAAALNGGANIPQSLQKGGMSVKFVQSSDNMYVQYRLMSDTFNTTSANWQGVDDEPTAGSDNLAKSGGVYDAILESKAKIVKNIEIALNNKYIDSQGIVKDASGYKISQPIALKAGETIEFTCWCGSTSYLSSYSNGQYTPIYFGTIPQNTRVVYTADSDIEVVICGEPFSPTCTIYTSSISREELITTLNSLLQPALEFDGIGTITTGILAEVGKTYLVYVFDDCVISDTGVEVYCLNYYSSEDKLIVKETNKIYEFTPAHSTEIRVYNNNIENHFLIVEKTSALKNIIQCLVPTVNSIKSSRVCKLNISEWNIGYWNNGVKPYGVPDADVYTILPRVRALLTKLCADIMVITEWVKKFDRSQTIDAYDLLFKQFYPYRYTRGDTKPAIFSKYPVVGSEGTFITAGGTYTKAVVALCGIQVVICAIHLPSAEGDRNTRMQMISDIITEYADIPYVIVVGDTNIYNTDELQAFITAGWVLGNCGYWGNIDTWYTGTWPIDNVITKGFGIDNFKKIEDDTRAGVSDHYPVVADISSYM